MRILAIETSCDETAIAILEIENKTKIKVLANCVSSQIKTHAPFGGVVPSLAAREHAKNISFVFESALEKAEIKNIAKEIDLITVTSGPGLAPALLIGIAFAKGLAFKYSKPLIASNHMEGHIYSNYLAKADDLSEIDIKEMNKPVIHLIVSGGHTEIVLTKKPGQYKIIGETQDDAVGEAFDKVARLLGLGYPGGPEVSKRAQEFKKSILDKPITLPRPMAKSKDFNFSYSGLKTAVLYKVKELKEKNPNLDDKIINEICYEFQEAATDVLVDKTIGAAKKYKVKKIMLSGGVSANKRLREKLSLKALGEGIEYGQPEMEYTTDNAAMIGIAGFMKYQNSKNKKFDWRKVEMDANLSL